jgi:hypothetical protein
MSASKAGTERPLVTFAIFAYNQERYIAETIAGAFAQNYSPLEIIISDDVSTDGTWAAIKREASCYQGPHQVRTRRSRQNVGLFRHVQEVAEESHGKLLIISGGDDISLPHRTSVLVSAWQASGAVALCSSFNRISEEGEPLEPNVYPLAPGNLVWRFFTDKRDRPFLAGQTAAYERSFITSWPLADKRIFHEDSVATIIIHALALKMETVAQPLVQYRVHDKSYSNLRLESGSVLGIEERERATASYAAASNAYLSYLLDEFLPQAAAENPALLSRLDLNTMRAFRRRSKIEGSWTQGKLLHRLHLLLNSSTWHEAKIMLPRLIGLRWFARLKFLVRPRG